MTMAMCACNGAKAVYKVSVHSKGKVVCLVVVCAGCKPAWALGLQGRSGDSTATTGYGGYSRCDGVGSLKRKQHNRWVTGIGFLQLCYWWVRRRRMAFAENTRELEGDTNVAFLEARG
ncbi:hypothetical protein PVAP13_8NG226801 [Panicum virgatum]|uniref:Uncharacterized protein n=1 Tax=Panicum virgatum TaxID=38727 RepID=A0A8T0P891_PANVG|nr:hypothetical protein PVAP13_8NG226801 [Panicum virgatum]